MGRDICVSPKDRLKFKSGMAENSKEGNAFRLGEKMNSVEVDYLPGLEHMGDTHVFDQRLHLNISEL
jgi:hypothetical protein